MENAYIANDVYKCIVGTRENGKIIKNQVSIKKTKYLYMNLD